MSDMSSVEAGINLLVQGSPRVLSVVNKLGGLSAFISAAPDLLALAKLWNQLNQDNPEEAVPNAYGMQAFAEIKARQREFGFEGSDVDGIIGNNTWREINKRLKMLDQRLKDDEVKVPRK